MAFTRDRIQTIISNDTLTTGEKVDQIFAMHGQTISEGYVSKKDAETMKEDAVKGVKFPDPKDSDVYKQLDAEFTSYKTRQEARHSEDYKGVKEKFFDAVYDSIDRKEGAKPIAEQMEALRKDYAEYFEEVESEPEQKPTFSRGTEGSLPKGGQKSFDNYWGFVPKAKE